MSNVTIVIPTFNRAGLVAITIESALNQTVLCDVVVCDHGSTDHTPQVLEKYRDKVTYIRREKDFGPHFCWLEGVLHAKTEFVHIHFDDDIMKPTFIEETLALMADDVGVVFTEFSIIEYPSNKIVKDKYFNFSQQFASGVHDSKILEKLLLGGVMLSPACCLYRKDDLLDGLYQGNLPLAFQGAYHGVGPDHFFTFLAVLRYPNFGYVDKALAIFGSHEGSISVEASQDTVKAGKISNAYESVRSYYRLLKSYKTEPENEQNDVNLYSNAKTTKKRSDIALCFISLERALKYLLKAIGLRKKEVRS